jgi:hypothetical protein
MTKAIFGFSRTLIIVGTSFVGGLGCNLEPSAQLLALPSTNENSPPEFKAPAFTAKHCDQTDPSHDHADDEVRIQPVTQSFSAPQSGASCYTESFEQPNAPANPSVDILFVADTSHSMDNNRRKVADGITSLIRELPPGGDYRIGVMVAHGSRSPYSGLLWRIPNSNSNHSANSQTHPYVLSSQQMNQSNLRGRMRALMASARDYRGEQGETGLYSFLESLKPAKFAENQARGFYRPGAGLAVIFIADENDFCAVYPSSAQGMPGMTSAELALRNRDCAGGIAAQTVIDAAQAAKGSSPVIFGAVMHDDPTRQYWSHESFGWGYDSVVALSQGATIDIDQRDYDAGLEMLGSLIRSRIELITSRRLEHSPVDEATIQIRVDGVWQNGSFVPATNEVYLSAPSSAGSLVEINYCLQVSGGGGGIGI